jgi:glycosyltransferase involved in cell wall biosynthesis
MSNLPLVSIITPSYNQGQFIEETILSVKHQTYPKIEHIIVDGGSVDNTLDILHKYEGTYNMRWLSEPDEGMYYAINKGFGMARGEILAYLNSDDMYLPWAVEVAVATFSKTDEAGIIFGDLIVVNVADGWIRLWFYQDFDYNFYARTGFIGQPSVFIRRNVWETIGPFDTAFRLLADCEYWLRAATNGIKLVHCNEFLAVDRLHPHAKRVRRHLEFSSEEERIRKRYCEMMRVKQDTLLKFNDALKNALFRRYQMLLFVLNIKLGLKPKRGQRLASWSGCHLYWANMLQNMVPFLSPKVEVHLLGWPARVVPV